VIWWLKASRGREVLPVAVLTGLVGAVLSGRQAPVPSLTLGGMSSAPAIAVLALLPMIAFFRGFTGLPAVSLATAVRGTATHSRILALALLALTAVPAYTLAGGSATLELVRDCAGLLGLSLIGAWLWADRGALGLPVGYLFAAFLVGRPRHGDPSAWAWILSSPGTVPALVASTALLTAGLVLLGTLPLRLMRTDP
jgi:hypothetical protein